MSQMHPIRAALLEVARERYQGKPTAPLAAFIGAIVADGPVHVDDGIIAYAGIDRGVLAQCGWHSIHGDGVVYWQVEASGQMTRVVLNGPDVVNDPTEVADRRHGWRIWRVDDNGLSSPFEGGRGTFRRRGNLCTAECPHHRLAEIPATDCKCGLYYVGDWQSFWAGIEYNVLNQMVNTSNRVITYGSAEGRIASDPRQKAWDSMRATRYRILGALVPRGVEHLLPASFDVPLRRLDWDAEPDKIARAATMLVDQIDLQGDSR